MKVGRICWNRFWGSYFTVCHSCPDDRYCSMRVYGTVAEAYNALITHYVLAHVEVLVDVHE